MFNHKHYVPIIKAKEGEIWATMHLSAPIRKVVTPLFEIPKHKEKDHKDQAISMCDEIASAWGTTNPFFLDSHWLHAKSPDPALIKHVFDYARSVHLKAIPVIRLSYNTTPVTNVIKSIHANDQRGAMLRIVRGEATAHAAIASLLHSANLIDKQVHLLLDYKENPMDLIHDVPTLPNLSNWRTFTAASAAFPGSIADLDERKWHHLQRDDWLSWLRGITTGHLTRKPTFADYTLRDSNAGAGGGNPPVTLKYTKDKHWLVYVNGRLHAKQAPNMFAICADLVSKPAYDGPGFSRGDFVINETALKFSLPVASRKKPGGPTQWLRWGISHHMTYAATQIQSHPLL